MMDLEQELNRLTERFGKATQEEDPEPLTSQETANYNNKMDDFKQNIRENWLFLSHNETDEGLRTNDSRLKEKLMTQWDSMKCCIMQIITTQQAERVSDGIYRTIKGLEALQMDNPTKSYKEAIATINPKMYLFKELLDSSSIVPPHGLWDSYDDYERRLYSMMATTQPTPSDAKDFRGKVHDKGSYKVSALAIPKFDGKIQGWVPFWQEFEHAIHKKTDIEDTVKMVYLKQAITDPGLQTTITDLGIEDGSYAAAIKLLHNRYDKPRVMHRLVCESLRDLKSSQKISLTEMADSAQHILLGFTRLKQLGVSETITSLVESAMGSELKEQWLNYTSSFKETPPAEKVIEFLRMRADREDDLTKSKPHYAPQERSKQKPYKKNKGMVASVPIASNPVAPSPPAVTSSPMSQPKREYVPCKYNCTLCSEKHYCYHCDKFKAFSPKQRQEHVARNSLCQNCLKPGHTSEQCRSLYKCAVCKLKHNSLLHDDSAALASPALGLASASAIIPDGLLMTANVLVTGTNGITHTARAFIDGGSSVTLISAKLKTALALKPTGQKMSIDGVGSFVGETQHPMVHLTLSSPRDKAWEKHITAISMPKVIRDLPLKDASITTSMPHLQNLVLADPLYHKVGPIDMLLGLDVFPYIFKSGKEEGPPNTPVAWDTVFGWTVLGMYNEEGCTQAISASTLIVDPLSAQDTSDQMLFHLWKTEEPQRIETALLSTEEQRVEEHFDKTHEYLVEEKRYRVALPRTLGDLKLGESRGRALVRAQANERSLLRKERWPAFQSVMDEYVQLGHAVAVKPQDIQTHPHYYMPVHSVLKETSTSTKVRAVFDASAPSASGFSLNDLLAVGPTLQPTLEKTLLRFRLPRIAISGDISKMYREILLSPEDRCLHRYLWRKELSDPWQDWEMQRVTFGVTSSPYMAVKTLLQTAADFGQSFPKAQKLIRESFYVDDFFGGADTVQEAVMLRKQINEILSQGGFTIKKWRSSSPAVLKTIPEALQESIPDQRLLDSHSACYPKALGLIWDSRKDEMATHVEASPGYTTTKRGLASDIAKTFDVLGWLSPVILEMKILYRSLWQKHLGWDQEVPPEVKQQHKRWRDELPLLANIRLPRHYCQGKEPATISLHGFSDASDHAFSAVIYLRAEYKTGPPSSALVFSKTRVAPLVERSTPELELCGAHLLARVLETVGAALEIPTTSMTAYSDSTIVLAWLDGKPKRYRTYVSNRISRTSRILPPEVWHYVPTKQNPADCASRGIKATELLAHPLWWQGPPWLKECPLVIPPTPGRSSQEKLLDEEHKPRSLQIVGAVLPPPSTDIETCANTWVKVVRILCWMNRFLARVKKQPFSTSKYLSVSELEQADFILKRRSQLRSYGLEMHQLASTPPQPLPTKSSILALHPEMTSKGLLCVGGRLSNALVEEQQKHPTILSAKDRYTRLLMTHYHCELMHGGPTAMLSHAGNLFFISGARRLAREICNTCVVCRKAAARLGPQLMGQLPPARLNPDYVFFNVGLDYAGPYMLKEGYVRRPVQIKCWLAVFVCFCTKAVHLELVKDATADSLVACLKRFCSRRGLPHTIHSDNGSTMVGAKNELAELYSVLQNSVTQENIQSYLLGQKVQWKLTPIKAPHFGGLWEAAVKAAKYHLKREIGQKLYTYDELETILCQAEACLNSRPLGVMASHPLDGMTPLTPGHFLVGRSLKAYPAQRISDDPGPAKRWEHCQKVAQKFWHRWSHEYLQQLQRAVKWHRPVKNYMVGDIVLLTENETYQCEWITAKITAVYPGKDGVVRTVDLQIEHISTPDKWSTKEDFIRKMKRRTTISRRPISKLSMLLAVDELPEHCRMNIQQDPSGTTFQPPPACLGSDPTKE